MRRWIWLSVAVIMFAGGGSALALSVLLAAGRWWYGAKWPDHRVSDLAQAGLVFWVFAAGSRWAAGPAPARAGAAGDYAEGRDGAVPDRRGP